MLTSSDNGSWNAYPTKILWFFMHYVYFNSLLIITCILTAFLFFNINEISNLPIATTNISRNVLTLKPRLEPTIQPTHVRSNSFQFLKTRWLNNVTCLSNFPCLILEDGNELNNKLNMVPMKWLLLNKISSIVIFADSHGPMWLESLSKFFDSTYKIPHKTCKTISNEGGSRSINNTFYNIDNMLTHSRECSHCQSYIKNCYPSNNTIIELKFLSQEFVLDTEIQRYLTHWDANYVIKCHNEFASQCINEISYSTQEFYLKNYFKINGYPNIIIRFATYMHDINRFTEIEFKRNFHYYLQLLLNYINKNNTKIVWITTTSYAAKSNDPFIVNGNKKINRFNQIAISEILQYGNDTIHIVPLDLFQITLTLRQQYGNKWNQDIAHLNESFYLHITSFIWKWIQMYYFAL